MLSGPEAMLQARSLSEHDFRILEKVAHVMSGGQAARGSYLTEQELLDLEREAFLSLCGMSKTQERIEFMLKTGKPLRN
jgi:3-hydroxyacyl-CoA dehydrogenase